MQRLRSAVCKSLLFDFELVIKTISIYNRDLLKCPLTREERARVSGSCFLVVKDGPWFNAVTGYLERTPCDRVTTENNDVGLIGIAIVWTTRNEVTVTQRR